MTCAPRPRARWAMPRPHQPYAGHHHGPAGQHDVGGPDDPVDGGLAGAVRAVQHQPGAGGVRGDRGEGERALAGHPAQPDDPGRGGLAPAQHLAEQVGPLSVQRLHQVAAVVHDQVRAGVQGPVDVLLVGRPVGPGPGEHHRRAAGVQRGRDVVLGGQRVRGGQVDLRAPRAQRLHQYRRFRGDVQASGYRVAGQRFFTNENLADAGQHRHGTLGPADPGQARAGQPGVRDVGRGAGRPLAHGVGDVS